MLFCYADNLGLTLGFLFGRVVVIVVVVAIVVVIFDFFINDDTAIEKPSFDLFVFFAIFGLHPAN